MIDKRHICGAIALTALCAALGGCEKKFNPSEGTPKPAKVATVGDMSLVEVARPELFPLARVEQTQSAAEMNATGVVSPDVSREVPVISLASGRVIDIKTRLGDAVKKGQLLLRVQSNDVTGAYNAYLKAVNDEQLANKAYTRVKDLYQHGAIPLSSLEQAEDSENDAKADLNAANEQLVTLGIDKKHPSSIVNVYAPITGVVISQNVTNAAAVGVTYSGSSTAFTIADLTKVWVLCDVYENDLPNIALGQDVRVAVNGYPDKPLSGKISEIDPTLDASIRTAKVRIELVNPGFLKLGMFVDATFTARKKESRSVVPTSAILHLHDRNWVFLPEGDNRFRRVEVKPGRVLPNDRQELLSGVSEGQSVVSNVLQLESTLEAQ